MVRSTENIQGSGLGILVEPTDKVLEADQYVLEKLGNVKTPVVLVIKSRRYPIRKNCWRSSTLIETVPSKKWCLFPRQQAATQKHCFLSFEIPAEGPTRYFLRKW